MRKLLLIAALAIAPICLSAARLVMTDGRLIRGQFISGTSQYITFRDEFGADRRYDLNEVRSIEFLPEYGDSGNNNNRYPSAQDNRYPTSQYGDQRYGFRQEGRVDYWATIPAGARLSVRTDEYISAQTADESRTYPAHIQQDVLDTNGRIVIPRGSEAAMVVRPIRDGGVILDLSWVGVNGRQYMVDSSDVVEAGSQGLGANRRTGEYVGGGAALGALIGAIAGGGKGAAIGALAGGGAGAGASVLTRGREVRVPAESVLNFQLEQPLRFREMR